MLFRDVHSVNALLPILVTESGIVTLIKDVHPLNAPSPRLVIELGISMLTNELQRLNADKDPVIELGILIFVIDVQPPNA